MSEADGWIAGVYPLLPKENARSHDAHRILHALRDVPGFGGYELPLLAPAAGGLLDACDESWLLSQLQPHDRLLVTLIPGTAAQLSHDPDFGLAAVDAGGRSRALAFAHRARDAVRRANDAAGRASVVAVALHSAPGGDRADVGALRASLEGLSAHDWDGARLVIEHCDDRNGPAPAKGFLSLAEEMSLGVGIVINWGRSAIERHDPSTPVTHIHAARERDLLAGVMFSGVSDRDLRRGGAWGDVHVAPREALPESPASVADEHSLLTREAALTALEAAGAQVPLRGLKVAAPASATTAERVRLLRASATALFG